MTQVAFQIGRVIFKDGQVATGDGCCCKCARCIKDGEWACEITTQEECEECEQIVTCYTEVDGNVVETTVADCDECFAQGGFSCVITPVSGFCGTWEVDHFCVEQPCCESCLPECAPALNAIEDTADYLKQSYLQAPFGPAGPAPYTPGWEASVGDCTLVWVTDVVSQTNVTGKECGTINGVTQYAIRSWVRHRLFLIDCRTRTMRDVTGEALNGEYGYTVCQVPSQNNLPLCDPPFCNDSPNPGFLDANPTLVCP